MNDQPDAGVLTPRERDLVLADLGELLELLGLGNYARPQSPHEVFQMCLAKLREQSHAAYRNWDGSYHTSPPPAAEWMDRLYRCDCSASAANYWQHAESCPRRKSGRDADGGGT